MSEAMREELNLLLKEIEDREGRLTPDLVVDAARDPEHPLHARFEWDDGKAAQAHRIATARRLIASAQIRIRYSKVVLSAPAYVRDPAAESGVQGYRSVVKLRDEDEESRSVILGEMRRVTSILKRTRALVLALGKQIDLDRLEAEVESFIASVSGATGAGEEAGPPSS